MSILSDSNQKQEISLITFPEPQFFIKTATEFADNVPVTITTAVCRQAYINKKYWPKTDASPSKTVFFTNFLLVILFFGILRTD